MLFRLKEFDEMVDAMLDRKMIFEALHVLQNYPCPKLNIKKLLSIAERTKDKQCIEVVERFIKEKNFSN